MFQDEKGNILSYILSQTQHKIALWNSTRAIEYGKPTGPGTGNTGINYWRPSYGVASDARAGIMWNNTIPAVEGNPSIIKVDLVDGVILTRGQISANATYPDGVDVTAGYSTVDGHQMWVKFRTGDDAVLGSQNTFGINIGPGAYVIQRQENMVFICFNIKTGEKMWTSTPRTNPWGSYYTTIGDTSVLFAYGNVYVTSYDGTVQCYEVATGKNLWNTFIGSSGFETPYGTWPLWGSLAVADGKVYAGTNEHSINQPMYRGERLYCFDAYTGDIIWNVYGIDMNPIISDGYLVTFNSYDMQNYCFGKGPSATTVLAPMTTVPLGTSVLIQGTVTDESPGTKQSTQDAIFQHGVPAISDESMGPWMEYVYMQKPQPTNATGVTVFLQAMKSDGTVIDIWHTETDIMGHYEYTWNPPDADTYKILATFEGSESYYSSSDQCGLSIGPAASSVNVPSANEVASQVVSQLPVQTPVPTAPSASEVANQVIAQIPVADNTMILVAIAVLAVLVVVNIVLVLRKQKKD